MKKAKFIVLVLGVILAFAMFAVACDDKPLPDDNTPETETYTVTFVNGETTVKEAEVQKGNALTAENMPGNPTTDADKAFDGWFSGETEIKVGYIPTADVTASAVFTQLKKVEFKVGEEVVKTVYVRPGAALSAEQLPEEPDMGGYSFSGWYNGDEFFDTDENTVSADMTLVANFVKTSYIIKFEADGEVIDTKYIAIGPDAKFEVTDIPSAPASEEGEVFLGWYNGGVKAVSGGAVTADGTYVATFVSEASYTGVWYNDSEKIMVYFENGKVNLMGLDEITYTYDNVAGSISFEEGSYTSKETFTLLATGDVMQLTHGHFDEYGEEFMTDTYVLYKAAPVDYAGVYNKDKTNILTVADGGIVTSFNGRNYYARMFADGDAYKIEFKSYSYSDMKTVNAVVDDLGNIVVTGDDSVTNGYKGVFVKGMKSVSYYYNDDSNYLYVYTLQDDSVLYVFTEDFTAFDYAVIEGTVATDNIITITAFDKEYIAKIVSSYKMEFASEERGEYTLSGGSDKITLDGFGSATVGDGTKAYYMLGITAVFDNGESGAAVLDLTGKTYTNAVRDGKQGTFTYFDGWSDKIVILDGFGGLVQERYSTYYYGTYEFAADKVTFVGVEDGVYTVTADGNVFVDDEDEFHAFVKEGYDVDSQINSFVGDNAGWWVNDKDPADYLFIDTDAEKVTYKDKSYSYETNWDSSKLLFTVGYIYDYILTVVDGKLNVTYEGDNGSPVTDVYTSAPEPVIEQDEYVGVWTAGGNSFWFDGYGTVVVDEDAVKYTRQPDNSVKFDYGNLTLTALLTDGTMSISWDDGEYTGKYDNTAPAVLDAFAGVWNAPAEDYYQYVLTFSGAGVVHVYNVDYVDEYVSYKVAGNVATFYANLEDWTCTVDGDSMAVLSKDSDGFTSVNATYTKQVEAAADAFAGTYSNGTNTLVFNGDGTGKFNDDAFTYTISDKTAIIAPFGAFDGESNTATLGEDGNIELYLSDSYMENTHSGNYVKQAEAQPDAFAGTWTGKVGPNTYTVVCDGLGNININGSDYTYTPGTDTIVAGYFTVTMKDADTMHVVYADDDYNEFEGDLTKSA